MEMNRTMDKEKKEEMRISEILSRMDHEYGTDKYCFLEYKNAYQLLVATILSAQCTDKRVNKVTKHLFLHYPDPASLMQADIKELEGEIHELGFFRSKAANLKAMAEKLVREYDSVIPSSMEELTSLPGVGRKTANVIRGNVYDIPSVVVDTHVKRISGRLGLTDETEPEKIEHDLEKKVPRDHWILINIQFITFGREICKAQNPKCDMCFVKEYCKK